MRVSSLDPSEKSDYVEESDSVETYYFYTGYPALNARKSIKI